MSEQKNDLVRNQQSRFTRNIIHDAAFASNGICKETFDLETAKSLSAEGIAALSAQNGLESMLAAQMLSIHQLQQSSMAQANILAKLQGIGGQKIIVERVDVSHVGQAIIGTINGSSPADKGKT